jgi:hypothetical protein
MSNMFFEVYRDDVMRLARSIVIKFDHVAEQINTRLKEVGLEVDPDHPETWKYYLHLAGEYHPTDVTMSVRSMDTLEMIDFTKANLAIHRATAREYKPGSIYYNNLVRSYPDQATLINGILYPIELQTAIDSNNGDILYYDPKYVEDNEYTFAHDLQSWVTTFYTRWYNDQFNFIDDLYLAAFLGHLYMRLPMGILLIRLKNAKTPKAHSFHIREYLASHGKLDEFIPYLTKAQQLYLYRNIAYLLRNAGKQHIWDELVDKILTPRGIPLVKYELKQNTEFMPDSIYSQVDMVKSDINFKTVTEDQNKSTVGYILEREDELARDNPLVRFDAEKEIIDKVRSDKYSTLPTKVFDSAVIDRSASSVRTRTNVLLNEWLHLAASNRYRAYIQLPNPRTGDLMSVSVRDAYIIMLYAYQRAHEIDQPNIPSVVAYEVLRDPLPNKLELKTLVDPRLVPDKVIDAIMDRTTPMRNYISTEQFYLDCVQFHSEYVRNWELYSFQEHMLARALCENVVKANYIDRMCKLAEPNTKFVDYFKEQGLEITDFTQTEYEELTVNCINIATGANLYRVITLGEIQRELLRLMARLSSYPLQYLRNVAYTDFHVLGIVCTRLGDIEAEAGDDMKLTLNYTTVQNVWSEGFTGVNIPDLGVMPNITLETEDTGDWVIPVWPCISDLSLSEGHYCLNINQINVQNVSIVADNEPSTTGELPEYDNSTDPTWPKP